MNRDLERIYARLPIALQHAACSLVGLYTERTRYGEPFRRLLADATTRASWPQERIDAFRDARLRAFIEHAVRTTRFYQRWFADAGVAPTDIRTLEDLKALPVLTREHVRELGSELVSVAVPKSKQRVVYTSGTTGGGLRLTTVRLAVQEQRATWWRHWSWHGIDRNTPCAVFGGRSIVPATQRQPPFWRYNLPGRQLLFSSYHMSPLTLPAYVEALRKQRPRWLHGYPSSLGALAGYVVENGIDLGYEIRFVTTGSENLLPHQAAVMERAFGVRPRQHYGMAEAIGNISECDLGRLHVDEDFAAVEFAPIDGGQHRIVGTNFTNPAMPLVRYDISDVVTIDADERCRCGRPGRLVASIDGRQDDYVVLKDGSRLGRMGYIFKEMVRVREAQIRQERAGELTIAIVRGREFCDEDERRLMNAIEKRVGGRADVRLEYVERLPRTPTGKLRLVVSEVGREA